MMKLLAFFGLLALSVGCKESAVDGRYTIGEGKSVTVATADRATLAVSTIQNSICPPGTVCIRGGEALVTLVATQDGSSITTTLCTGPDCQAAKGQVAKTTITVGSRMWTLELVEVLRTTPEQAVIKVDIR